MKVSFVTVGRIKSSECEKLVRYYLKLIGKFASAELVELPAGKANDTNSQDQALLKYLGKKGSRTFLTILDEQGKLFTSSEFASRIEKIKDASHSEWIIAVGGAHGYSKEIKDRANLLWSLSPLIFPHELALVTSAEQVFRGFTILNNHPYHNE